jgi:hypothetical protein
VAKVLRSERGNERAGPGEKSILRVRERSGGEFKARQVLVLVAHNWTCVHKAPRVKAGVSTGWKPCAAPPLTCAMNVASCTGSRLGTSGMPALSPGNQ